MRKNVFDISGEMDVSGPEAANREFVRIFTEVHERDAMPQPCRAFTGFSSLLFGGNPDFRRHDTPHFGRQYGTDITPANSPGSLGGC